MQARRDFARVGDGFGQIGEQPRHFRRRFQMPLIVQREQPPGRRQRHVIANAGEDVERLALRRRFMADSVGRD